MVKAFPISGNEEMLLPTTDQATSRSSVDDERIEKESLKKDASSRSGAVDSAADYSSVVTQVRIGVASDIHTVGATPSQRCHPAATGALASAPQMIIMAHC